MKHAAGPWKFWTMGYATGVIEGANGDWVCLILDFGDIAEDQANAHLIAAAPDLLKSCEKFLEWINNLERNIGKDALVNALPNDFGRQVGARAIAKAKEGRIE